MAIRMAEWNGLPNDCALLACATCYSLARFGITCRPLAVTYQRKPLHRHIVVIFEFEHRLRAYERDGSITLSKKLSWQSAATAIARDWAKNPSCEFPFKALKGEWY